MGRIQTNIGLVTGIPIGDTVDQLIALSAKPRDMLVERTGALQQEQIAVTELSALLMSVQYVSQNLGKPDIYDQRQVSSSNENLLSATMTSKPPNGTYQFTPLRMSQYQQMLSSGLKSDSDPIGEGSFTFRYGAHVERNSPLELLGGGSGITRGRIRITDRSGASAEIDLSTAQSVDDVLDAINSNTAINVTATTHGDRFRLIDNTGQSVSNLMVQDLGSGSTAASLGLAGINSASSIADGQDMLRLTDEMELDLLNDGNGVAVSSVLHDIYYELRDGTTGTINFSPIVEGSSEVDRETTLGEVLEIINAQDPDRLRVEIGPDGDRLVITDLTEGEGSFKIESAFAEEAATAESLGIAGESSDGVIVGRRLLGGLGTVLVSSLGGGHGLGELGALELTDRDGSSDTVILSGAETLEEVIEIINGADVGIVASVNGAKNGIRLNDTTGSFASNLIVADADEKGTAGKLGLSVDTSSDSADSGDMHLQVVSGVTRLSDLNGGAGIRQGNIMIYDSQGHQDLLKVDSDMETVDDLIRAINRLDVYVFAELNATGDGIRIQDKAGGEGKLQVYESGSNTAADLHLLGGMKEVDIDGQITQVVDGSSTYTVELGADDSLADLKEKINALAAGVTASTFVDGSNRPFRLSLISDRAGAAGQFVVDTSGLNFSIDETVEARDALLVLGKLDATGSNVLISSNSNKFADVVPGVSLEIKGTSNQTVTVSVEKTDTDLFATVQATVENYNRFREKLGEYTAYDAETNTRSVLTGDSTALRLETGLTRMLGSRFNSDGSFHYLSELGISLTSDGTLQFDRATFESKYSSDPDSVESFFRGPKSNKSLIEFGITIEDRTLTIDQDRLREKYAEDPNAVLSLFRNAVPNESLTDLGISFSDGTIQVDEKVLYAKFGENPKFADSFLSRGSGGFSAKLDELSEQLTGQDTSLMANRFITLSDKIERNEERIAWLTERLETERERLYMQFYRMEIAIGKMQSSMSALSSIQPLTPLQSSSNS
jgi:flagellar hook-associated protein 2